MRPIAVIQAPSIPMNGPRRGGGGGGWQQRLSDVVLPFLVLTVLAQLPTMIVGNVDLKGTVSRDFYPRFFR
jgi:hypothetical protein